MNPLPQLLAGLALSCLMPAAAHAGSVDRAAEGIDCATATSTMERDLCASDRAEDADAVLNTTYGQARQQLRQQAADGSCTHCADAEQQLVVAQRAWIQLRDKDCSAVYAFHADGTSRNGAQMHCLTTHAQDRTRQLRDFYEL
ncbi:lysozyme inhibitor LprI family protein [Stenotrophomonas sp. Iso1]|uniref:lysozyme inhibitor LprI family protein n=1 Tax=Stenotrophomonas sp. Iso1 TaxID=2977283 RepID=UPI0022B7C93B|nr:lysozyme inhibitor LprI family protein [Stenotrophomonas sp. Iso1]